MIKRLPLQYRTPDVSQLLQLFRISVNNRDQQGDQCHYTKCISVSYPSCLPQVNVYITPTVILICTNDLTETRRIFIRPRTRALYLVSYLTIRDKRLWNRLTASEWFYSSYSRVSSNRSGGSNYRAKLQPRIVYVPVPFAKFRTSNASTVTIRNCFAHRNCEWNVSFFLPSFELHTPSRKPYPLQCSSSRD